MRTRINLLGLVLVVGGLVALFKGLTALVSVGACFGEPCPNGGDIVFFPVGLVAVILGAILWSAGRGVVGSSDPLRDPVNSVGFLGTFGLVFFGLGAAMWLADQQPDIDHTTNVLTVLGLIFAAVGIVVILAEVAVRRSGAHDAQVLATGTKGRATVLAVRDTNVTVNMNPMIALDLRAEIPGQPVFQKTVRTVISRLQVGDYRPGMVLAVAANPKTPQEIVVDWANSPIGGSDSASDQDFDGQAAAVQAAIDGALSGRVLARQELARALHAAADKIAAQQGAEPVGAFGSPIAPSTTPVETGMPSMPTMPIISPPDVSGTPR